jgi:GDPmannose 4,6-dehydratase
MQLVLAQDEPGDFIIGTGVSRSLASVLDLAFSSVGLSSASYVTQDPSLMRPADVASLVGDPTKAREQLGWEPSVPFEDVIAHMVRVDVERLRTGVEESAGYLQP